MSRLLGAGTAALAVVATLLFASPEAQAAAPHRLAVGLVTAPYTAASLPAVAAEVAADVAGTVVRQATPGVVAIEVPAVSDTAAVAALRADPRVAWAEPDVRYRAAVVPNDPCYLNCAGFDQYNLQIIGADAAWNITQGNGAVVVAALDTGVDSSHVELQGKVTVGPNFSTSANPGDANGHGTHVAGIVGALTNNSQGVAGLGWNTHVLSIKVLDDSGAGFGTDIAKGVYEAMGRGAKVINLSLAGQQDTALRTAVAKAIQAGVVVVSAAGNEGSSATTYPAGYDGVIGVAATTESDQVASFSNRGPWLDLGAPGDTVLSLLAPGGGCSANCYGLESGTSQASPLVAATAALMFAANPSLSGATVAALLNSTASQISGTGSSFSAGRLNAGAAVAAAVNAGSSGPPGGYRMVASDGGIFSFGTATFHGSTGNLTLNRPIVGMASTPSGKGYWMVASDGGIFSFGDAVFRGSTAGRPLGGPIVGMAPTSTGNGYWLAGADGSVHAFGDASFFGQAGNLNQPIVGIAASSLGPGYWLVARDGGIFTFGSAQFFGSTGNLRLNRPIVGIAPTPAGSGYWLVASDGGIFAFGDARFFGSTGNITLNKPVVGMAAHPSGTGYWLVATDGGIFAFGSAPFAGSTGNITLNKPVVGMTA